MTRSKTFVVLAYVIVALATKAVAQDKSDAATIRALEMKWAESYKQHSIEILSSLLAEEFVITIEDGNLFSKADTSATQPIRRSVLTLPKCRT